MLAVTYVVTKNFWSTNLKFFCRNWRVSLIRCVFWNVWCQWLLCVVVNTTAMRRSTAKGVVACEQIRPAEECMVVEEESKGSLEENSREGKGRSGDFKRKASELPNKNTKRKKFSGGD